MKLGEILLLGRFRLQVLIVGGADVSLLEPPEELAKPQGAARDRVLLDRKANIIAEAISPPCAKPSLNPPGPANRSTTATVFISQQSMPHSRVKLHSGTPPAADEVRFSTFVRVSGELTFEARLLNNPGRVPILLQAPAQPLFTAIQILTDAQFRASWF